MIGNRAGDMPGVNIGPEINKNWARLIQKVYEFDPLICPKCQGPMRIISFIEEIEIIEIILRHLGLWDIRNHDPPQPDPVYISELIYDDSDSQVPAFDYWS